MSVLYLVRHGMTDDSGKRITGYRPGVHLNKAGIRRAVQVANYLKPFPIKAIYASPLERAMETAESIATRHDLPVHPVDFLKELDFGDYQGKGGELSKDPLWTSFLKDPSLVRFPNGESVQQAQSRIVGGLDSLVKSFTDDDEIICVSHCEVLRLALAHALNIPVNSYMRLTISTGSVSGVVWNPEQKTVCFMNLVD